MTYGLCGPLCVCWCILLGFILSHLYQSIPRSVRYVSCLILIVFICIYIHDCSFAFFVLIFYCSLCQLKVRFISGYLDLWFMSNSWLFWTSSFVFSTGYRLCGCHSEAGSSSTFAGSFTRNPLKKMLHTTPLGTLARYLLYQMNLSCVFSSSKLQMHVIIASELPRTFGLHVSFST